MHPPTSFASSQTHARCFKLPPLPPLSPTFFCLPLCLAAHSHSLSCLCPFCMCEPRSRLPPVQEGNLIPSFCTCSQIPSLSRGWDCPSVNGKGILREIVAGNNKPTCHEDKSIFKASGFSRTTVVKSITTFIFWVVTDVLHSHAAQSDCHQTCALIYTTPTSEKGTFRGTFMKLWMGR